MEPNLAEEMNNQDENKNLDEDQNKNIDDGDQYSEEELRAMEKGWRPKEEFEGNPDDWRSAKDFNEFGEMKKQLKNQESLIAGMKRSHNEEIGNLNMLHLKQLEDKEKELSDRLDKAVDEGDTDEAKKIMEEQKANAIEKAVVTSKGSSQMESPQEAAILQGEWEEKNDWVFEDTPKARKAISAFKTAQAKGMNMKDSLAYIDERMVEFDEKSGGGLGGPDVNPNRLNPGITTGSGGRGSGKQTRKLTMNDLTEGELKYRTLFADGEEGDKAFLKTIENNRKGGQ